MINSKVYNDPEKGDYIMMDYSGYRTYIKWLNGRPKGIIIRDVPNLTEE